MQYQADNPQAYLQELEEDWRKEKLGQVRNLILGHDVNLEECIEYKMLAFGDGQSNVFHLNAQKAYVGLYVGNIDKIEGGRELLAGYNLGKGCIRIKKNNDLAPLAEFIQKAIDFWKAGGDTSC